MIRHGDGSIFQINIHEITESDACLLKVFSIIAVIYLWLFAFVFYVTSYYIVGIVFFAVSGVATVALILFFCISQRRQVEGELAEER
jgi:hypothetical protein